MARDPDSLHPARSSVSAAGTDDGPAKATPSSRAPRVVIEPDPRSVWRAGLVVIALVLSYALGVFVLHDGGAVIFQIFMAWLASIALEPAVGRLARRMRRGLATALVMAAVVGLLVVFSAAFGNLLVEQVTNLIRAAPDVVGRAALWLNERFGSTLDARAVLQQVHVSPEQLASVGADVAGGVVGFVGSIVGGLFSLVTISMFVFYLSADAPRLKRWVGGMLPRRRQEVFLVVWDLAVQKTGGYVAARVVLAAISGSVTAAFLLVIGMPYWLALGVWTGVVAQFVPTIGTYVAIALPVLVGLTSSEPVDGLLALAFALVYQQIENLTIEPRISANAVDMHPATAFASVLLGAALFGVSGALVAVPMAALMLALVGIYTHKYEVLPALASEALTRGRRGTTHDQTGSSTEDEPGGLSPEAPEPKVETSFLVADPTASGPPPADETRM